MGELEPSGRGDAPSEVARIDGSGSGLASSHARLSSGMGGKQGKTRAPSGEDGPKEGDPPWQNAAPTGVGEKAGEDPRPETHDLE